jgi:hypothetical protein
MSYTKCFFAIFIFVISLSCLRGQQVTSTTTKASKVFFIGEDEKNYEKMVQNYSTLLFTVCDNDMEVSFEKWTNLLKDLEEYSNSAGIDIKGVKLWLNVFWDKDGKIDHIVFYPKPNSKNLNYDNVKAMLANFISVYQSPLKYSEKFSHYGSASFPVFSKAVMGTEK